MLSSDQEVSSEFLALCESQLALLTDNLGASQTAVYLTRTWKSPNETTLVPVAVYPQKDFNSLESLPEIQPNQTKGSNLLLQGSPTELESQLVLPLIYKEIVMGLLITRREDRNWKTTEIEQIDQITQTIAIACLLDQRQAWYSKNLVDIQQIRMIEQIQLSDFLHQLRNPLTAVRTFGKLLLKRLIPGDENQKIATGLLRETEHIQNLVKQFELRAEDSSEVKSITGVKSSFLLPSLTLESVPVLTVFEPILSSAQAVAEAKNIEILVELSETSPIVKANAQALREVLQNLVDNALKYTPAGGKIKITTLTQPGLVGIAIHDTGCGIPDSVQERIFERHYRGIQADGDIPGTGLGLAIAKDLVEQMEGNIELISPNHQYFQLADGGEGTTFIVWLPKNE